MKKSTYTILALTAFFILGSFLFLPVFFRAEPFSHNYLDNDGEPYAIALQRDSTVYVPKAPVSVIEVTDRSPLYFRGAQPIVTVIEDSSLTAPRIVSNNGWAENITIHQVADTLYLDMDTHTLTPKGKTRRSTILLVPEEMHNMVAIRVPPSSLKSMSSNSFNLRLVNFQHTDTLAAYSTASTTLINSRFALLAPVANAADIEVVEVPDDLYE